MKKYIFLLMAMVVALSLQAQTCKVSATKNNGKVIQISVNLDSLKGKTLVTTISHDDKNNVILNMAYEGKESVDSVSVMAREDSSELFADTLQSDSIVAAENTDIISEDGSVEPEDNPSQDTPSSTIGGILDVFGLSTITSFVTGSIDKDSLAQYEEYGKKLLEELTQTDSTKYIPHYKQRKWKWLDKTKSYSTLELSGIFGKDFGNTEGDEEVNSEDYGMNPEKANNLGGSVKFSQVFIPGTYTKDGTFKPNRLHFGWSLGGLFALDYQKDYGWSTDFLGKIGIQAGEGITLGGDALIGGGTSPYAIYSTDDINYRVVLHNQWCFKYGAQVWLSMNYGGNTYTSLFARLVKSVAPSSIYDHPTDKTWDNALIDFDDGSWQVGFAVGYKFGYNPNLKDKRLQATIATGYNLIGNDKCADFLVELEKINQISQKLDFSYGLGFGQSLNNDNLKSFTLNGGWLYRLQPTHKFNYMIKFYAGVGEYIVGKELSTEDEMFEMSNKNIRKLCLKGGTNLGCAFRFGCNTLSASARIGYHYGFEPEYDGYKSTKDTDLKGWDITPTLSYTINF